MVQRYRIDLFLYSLFFIDFIYLYLGGKEFFKVVPKDNPPAKVFDVEGVQVNVSKSTVIDRLFLFEVQNQKYRSSVV